ncbi:MAG: hypothetical protein G01um101413_859 [Parcubacteria group bacterium Gr01-1014_13]|nr:MAG: hypothetical protein G01um101413_859 [Parcubacteria group bacterium Gr01-1014_13]
MLYLYIGVDAIVQRRKKKRAKKEAYDFNKERVVPGPSPTEIEHDEDAYVANVGISRKVAEHIQLIQLKTKAASPAEVLSDALRFYAEIVHMYGPGDQLLFRKSSEEGCTLLQFKPLSRIEKKIQG